MKRIFALLLLFCYFTATAQQDTSHIRVSLLTVGPGHQYIYEPFGHTAIRIIDSLEGTDVVFNYGTFNYSEPNFELKFMRGKLLYYLSAASYPSFVEEYIEAGRKVEEQELLIGGHEKLDIYTFLQNNIQPGNREYKYDFLFDNCATRIRDVFPKSLGGDFRYGKTIAAEKKITFRQIINRYLYKEHLERFGINLLLGSKVDKAMSNEDIMFLPDYLRDGVAGATVKGEKMAAVTVTVLSGNPPPPAGVNWALILTACIMLLTIAGFSVKQLRALGVFMRTLVLFLTGLLGCLMLFMWLGTDHQACQNNFNVLWALPTSLILVFRRRNTDRYIIVAVVLMIISLVLHVSGIQQMPLFELWPWLLTLLFIYGTIYKQAK